MVVDISQMERYEGKVPSALYPQLTIALLGVGLLFTFWFFIKEVTGGKAERSLFVELFAALLAAVFMGFGSVFLMLWVGIYI